jgi:hypothetical protein
MDGGTIRGRHSRAARTLVFVALAALALAALTATSASAKVTRTTWLCKPGMKGDPCTTDMTTTVVAADGSTSEQVTKKARKPPVDCFYVYPTVSEQTTVNADLSIEPEETQIAVDQASRFSQDCKVYAPMYPQLTLAAINTPGAVTPEASAKAYVGVLQAFFEYLSRYNKGRPFVLIGHSQGTAMLTQLIKEQIDPNAALRSKLVSAVLLGGNIEVPDGELVGGSFKNVPLCTAATDTGCAIAYSTFLKEPPDDSFFGRPNSPLTGGGAKTAGEEVACVNPTLLSQDGGSGPLLPYASTTPFPGALGAFTPTPTAPTAWVSTPDQYTAQCHSENGASWLEVDPLNIPGDEREPVAESLGPQWGLHLYDVNIALGNLTRTVALQTQAYFFGS